ncbi:MAG: LLM class F420-dependent oxidoreductase [Candidatus Tectimicrobiota bacterium]|nr:MAG: LLM class F420-dependent oxidoreductase [Candidatus Tectomicrobia bacterium]
MDIGLFAIGLGRTADPEVIARLARKADELGFASLWAPEHVVLFAQDAYTSRYPYHPSGKIGAEEVDWLDPFVALAYAAAHTQRIKLGTGICLVPQRNPLITAKLVASLDRLSKGRFLFGVGIGWLKEEFRALGVPPERRAERTCEYLEAMKVLWTQENPSFAGEFCAFPPLKALPKPVQQPHPPILFGGNSDAALRRAAQVGDGWFGFDLSPLEARERVQRLRAYAEEVGRRFDELLVSLCPFSKMRPVTREGLQQYREAGVQHLVVVNPTTRLERLEAALEEMAGELVAPARSL